jgi:hypothetical protein
MRRGRSCLVVLAVIMAGCATQTTTAPAPPPAPTPPKPALGPKEPSPPPVLSPQIGSDSARRQKQEAEAKIEGAEDMVRHIDRKTLRDEQQEIFATIQSFLSKARKALSIGDSIRAFNLAEKAHILAEELVRVPR